MDLISAAKVGDIEVLENLLQSEGGDANLENTLTFDAVDETRPKKSMYCAECYQRVKRRDRPALRNLVFGSTYSCDWPHHQRSVVIIDPDADICCCATPSGEKCNWLICLECFTKVTHGLKATHQMYGLQEGFTPLIAAASAGQIESVKTLLKFGAKVNTSDPNGLTPLLAATSAGHTDVVRLLLERGADINSVDSLGVCALFMACKLGDVPTVEVLLGFQPDLSVREKGGATLLHAAASCGNVGIMQALLDRGLSPRDTDNSGDTPLHWIPSNGSAAAVRLLLDRGADVNAQNALQYTPILLTALRDNPVAASTMLRAGAVTHIITRGWGTPLTASCLGNFHRVTEVLLAGGIDHSIGSPPLQICARRNYPLPAAACLKYGVKGAGDALITAADVGNPSVVKVILQHWTGEDDMDDRYLARALAHAAKSGVIASVKMLLEHGADATVVYGHNGETAADFAKSNKIKAMIKAHVAGDDIAALEEDEETVGNNRNHLMHALKKGTKKWGRSKIMIVGDGRAGKTALANSIMGEEFAHTESTIGINQMTCDVKYAEVGKDGGQWDEYTKPDKELEAALAKIVAARRDNEDLQDPGDEESGSGMPIGRTKGKKKSKTKSLDPVHPSNGTVSAGTQATVSGENVKISSTEEEDESEDEAEGSARQDAAMIIDDALVMKYLANMTDNTKFVISLFDYGGQTVFNVIHHLFLTRYGVYTLVFNMEQLVSADVAVRESCLSTISFWLNSIVVHTWNADTQTMAPIVIVGTHKDVVNDSSEHKHISRVLTDKFQSSVAWPFIYQNLEAEDEAGEVPTCAAETHDNMSVDDDQEQPPIRHASTESLCFFPVDNRKSRKDSTVVKMMKVIEDIIDKSDYVHVERPLTWLQTMDKLTASGKAYLPLVEVEAIAAECEVPKAAVPSLLSFLHEMGILMWHDDVSLRDIVILDAVSYFVTPVTTIICKHLSTAMDATRHVVDVHKECRKDYYDAWMRMVHQGIVNTNIIDTLLKECGQQAPMVLHLMIKFGLVVPLQMAEKLNGKQSSNPTVSEFLVPALLPAYAEAIEKDKVAVDDSELYTNTCYFVFSCSDRLSENGVLKVGDAANLGFLPRGLFERLICKAVEWCRETSAIQSLQSQPLYQDAAVLVFGNQKFRMRAQTDKNCIEVSFTKGNPLAVHQRLCEQLQQILDECMKSLKFFTALPSRPASGRALPAPSMQAVLVELDHLRQVADQKSGLAPPDGLPLMSHWDVVELFGDWLVDDTVRREYDVFLSFRWGTLDARFAERLRDRFSIYNVGSANRSVAVFLDNKRQRDGSCTFKDFARSLVNSLVIAPIVSADALIRLRYHDPQEVDPTLMEWFMALECLLSPASRVSQIAPVWFGARDSTSDAVGDLFSAGTIEALPDVRPKETVKAAIQQLLLLGVEPRMGLSTCTVRSIVAELKAAAGYCAWNSEQTSVVAHAAQHIIEKVQKCVVADPKMT